MPRFYVACPLVVGEVLALPERVSLHIKVLRLAPGKHITLFNNSGGEFKAVLIGGRRREISCQIVQFIAVSRESPICLGLIQAVSSSERMEFTLQKGVEMGVSVFQPVLSERSAASLVGEKAQRRVTRWKEIVCCACEQCGRNLLPEVRSILSIAECWHIGAGNSVRLILSPVAKRPLPRCMPRPTQVWLMVGPEGGFSAVEEGAAIDAGWRPWTLGPRILRTETAAIAAIAAIETAWGDYAVEQELDIGKDNR